MSIVKRPRFRLEKNSSHSFPETYFDYATFNIRLLATGDEMSNEQLKCPLSTCFHFA